MNAKLSAFLSNRLTGSVAALILALGMVGCSEPETQAVSVVPSVKTLEVQAANVSKQRRISGKLVAADKTQLSFAVSGKVQKVLVFAGQTISEGDVLAELDKEPFEIALSQAEAQLGIARAQFNEKKQRYKRLEELLAKQVVSVADYEVAESDLNVARGNLTVAEAAVDDAVMDLDNISLKSPFSGKVVERLIDDFQEVSAGSAAFEIESQGNLEVELLIPETLIHKVDYGQPVSVTFPTRKGLEIAGYVAEVGSQVVAGNAFPIKVQLNRTDPTLRSGVSALVALNISGGRQEDKLYLIPLSALALDAGMLEAQKEGMNSQERSAPVFRFLPESSTIELIQVQVGDIRGNELEVYQGLQEGDLIVVAGVAFLRDGMTANKWSPDIGLIN